MSEYRVDELAEAAGVTVDLVRSYQSKGLLPAPRHQGRVAWYNPRHLERLRTIKELKSQGHSLKAIASMLESPRPAGGYAGFSEAVIGSEERLDLTEVAERARVPPALLRSLVASGVLRPLRIEDDRCFTPDDARAVRMLLDLVGGGVPMEDFMSVAHTEIEAISSVASGAVELFMRYVREPLLAAGLPANEEAERLVAAFRTLLREATGLIVYNFQRAMLNLVDEEIEKRGTRAERAAVHRLVQPA